MSYYDEIRRTNIIGMCRELIDSQSLRIRKSDGRLEMKTFISSSNVWVHTKPTYRVNCLLWKNIIFGNVIRKLPREEWFVPPPCHKCFKVVVKPQTVKELFALNDLQAEMQVTSKAGLDLRKETFGNYAGYFYTGSISEGLECYKEVREAVDDYHDLGSHVSVGLIRACTEYEYTMGPSDKWTLTPENLAFDDLLNQAFLTDFIVAKTSDLEAKNIYQEWIDHAYANGDPTVIDGPCGGNRNYPERVTYEHLITKTKGGGSDAILR